MASVGQPSSQSGTADIAPTDTSGADGSGDGSGATASSGGAAGTMSASDGTTMTDGTTTSSGGTTSGGSQTPPVHRRVPILVTAGNAVLDGADRVDAARSPINDNLPNSAPITGTVTQVLDATGQALVRSGDGSAYLVDGLTAAPGSAVTIAAGDGHLVGGPGSNPLLGVSVISPTQTAGSVASVGVASNGTLLTAIVPTNPALAGVPAAAAGSAGNLASATIGTTQVAGGAQPATIGVSALSPTQATGTVLTAGVASGGNLATVNGTSVAAPTGGALTGAAGAITGAATGSLVDANAGTTQVIGGGQPAAIGVSALSPTQTSGSLLTVGAGSGGNLATLNGTTIAPPTGLTTPTVAVGGMTGVSLNTGGLGLH